MGRCRRGERSRLPGVAVVVSRRGGGRGSPPLLRQPPPPTPLPPPPDVVAANKRRSLHTSAQQWRVWRAPLALPGDSSKANQSLMPASISPPPPGLFSRGRLEQASGMDPGGGGGERCVCRRERRRRRRSLSPQPQLPPRHPGRWRERSAAASRDRPNEVPPR